MALKKSLLIASLGTLIEYYDYALFSLFLPFLTPVFFPAHSQYDALVMGFYAILIASIARPLGGLVFGYIGDKFGRKVALVISLYGIAIATLMIGILPSYHVIGIWAMILLTLIRAIQMLCYGGEYSGAGIYVVELAKNNRPALIGALLTAMALVGSVVASLVGIAITSIDKVNPNWRIGFVIGGLMGLIAIYFRRSMTESIGEHERIQTPSFKQICVLYPKEIFAGICIGGFSTLPFTTVLTFINPWLKTNGYLDSLQFMQFQFLLSTIAVVTLVLAGFFADRYSPARVMKKGVLALLILTIPLAIMLESMNLYWIISAEIILVILNEILLGPSNAYLKQIFPVNCRYRGVAVSFCLGMSLVGGLTPVIENYLYKATGHLYSIAIWIIIISFLTLLSLNSVKRKDQQF
jgi:MHS family proline/betaine transporter-like MFS transporter